MKKTTTLIGICAAIAAMMTCAGRSIAAEDSSEPIPAPGGQHSDRHLHARVGFDFSLWNDAPIQTDGLEKSFYTFAKDYSREATGSVNFAGRDPIENIFSMAYEPDLWLDEPILKIKYPALQKVFGGGHPHVSFLDIEKKRGEWLPLIENSKEIKTEMDKLFSQLNLVFDLQNADELRSSVSEKLLIVPTVDFKGEKTVWKTVDQLSSWTKDKTPAEQKVIEGFNSARTAFLTDDAAGFNKSSAEMVAALQSLDTPTFKPAWKFRLDRWDSQVGLFKIAGWTYLLAAMVFLVSYVSGQKLVPRVASTALGLGVALHVSALVIRGVLAGRTPVANLFESAVFIIGMMTTLSLIISLYYRTRVVGLAGATLGAFFMGIANNIPLGYGRKILPLIDALQSYWLNIHVTAMLTSYACFGLAFFVAASYVVRALVMRGRPGFVAADDPVLQYLDSLNFRIITIGVPILTGGVILGAVWASEAWGRPWGFDPKETAAAMTWMVYVLYLHCRLFLGWRGMRGILLSILGFGAVVFTYLGVSFFLPGLHSYVEKDGVSFFDFIKKIIPGK